MVQEDRERKVGGCFRYLLFIVVAVVLVFLALSWFRVGGEPEVTIEPAYQGFGTRTPVKVHVREGGRGLSNVRAQLLQEDRVVDIDTWEYTPRSFIAPGGQRTTEDTLEFDVGRETIEGLKQGEATLRITADRAGTWLRKPEPVVEELTLPVRLNPPSLSVISTQHYVDQGGSEVVVYQVGEGTSRDGVQAGEWFFPGFDLPGGADGYRFALFAVPYNLADQSEVQLIAEDAVGNRAARGFIDRFTPRPYNIGTIELPDSFLDKVVPEIQNNTPDMPDQGSPIDNYVWINSELRVKNRAYLKELAAESKEEFLWSEVFMQLRNGQVMSPFATERTYKYNGEEVDKQFHLGFDLATVARDTIPAFNDGVVVHAGYLGIYGNVVIIDHGYGLQTLYGHLSSVDVKEGDTVERGQRIGLSGETGLAGGDHLHYGIILHGLPVQPREWWDDHWIEDRIKRKLGDAMPFGGQSQQAAGG
jgi:murein DD-endopeptidase MepM/ murein hydrolase activator NlpD